MTTAGVQYAGIIIQAVGAVLAAISAFYWFYASRLGARAKPGGFDNDVATNEAAVRQAKLNGKGALYASFAAISQALAVGLSAYWSAVGPG